MRCRVMSRNIEVSARSVELCFQDILFIGVGTDVDYSYLFVLCSVTNELCCTLCEGQLPMT